MKRSRLEWFIFVVLISMERSSLQAAAAKPKMRVNGKERHELAIKENEQIRIECYGQDIVFALPQDNDIPVTRPTRPGQPFTLVVEEASSSAGGWYDCYEKSTAFRILANKIDHEYENVSSVFVYVDSADAALMTDSWYIRLEVKVNHTFVLTCYPDTPMKTPKCKETNKDPHLEISYVDKIGCVIRGLRLQQRGEYSVQCKLDDDAIDWSIAPINNSPTPDPKIEESGNHDQYMEGGRLELNCIVKRESNLLIDTIWSYPSSGQPDRVNISALNHIPGSDGKYRKRLVIEKLRPSDSGSYICTAFESWYEPMTATSVNISVMATSKPSLVLETIDTETISHIPKGTPVEWSLKIIGIPSLTVHWFGPDGRNLTGQTDNYRSWTVGSNTVWFRIEKSKVKDSGDYTIVASNGYDQKNKTTSVSIDGEPTAPKIRLNNTSYNPEERFKATCSSWAGQQGAVVWRYKETSSNKTFILANSSSTTIRTIHDAKRNSLKSYLHGTFNDTGDLTCVVTNPLGNANQTVPMIRMETQDQVIQLTVICALIVIVAIITTYLFIKIRRERKLKKVLQEAGLAHFEEGALECMNPELTISDQAELLPYDNKTWEFPKEQLKLGKQLGSGAFGVVMRAEARGICPEEESTTVAVKMVRRTAEASYIKALASELKIMSHLGKHLNVVNLLGACTKNIAKRELYIIVEYCRFGNLHNYLLRHRSDFIDQIDPDTGKVDPTIGMERLSRSPSVRTSNGSKYTAMNVFRSLSVTSSNSDSGDAELVDYRCAEDVNMSPDAAVLSNNSIQLGWRSNYKGDYADQNLRPICTKDLICWSWQVACGMEYLSARRILHGDLAARNVLLADNSIVKICDFGLAKTVYKDDNYKKKGDGLLPVKWMSIEAIRDRLFSTQSDVWAYGIVMWEFFTMARTPYHDMDIEKQYKSLVEGYRLEQPKYAPNKIYEAMSSCWMTEPTERPSFAELAKTIGSLMEDDVKVHYANLNQTYVQMNKIALENGANDYLAMSLPPDHAALSSPTHEYSNLPNFPEPNPSNSSYVAMTPINRNATPAIFSPRPSTDNTYFVFPPEVQDATKQSSNEQSPDEISIRQPSQSDQCYANLRNSALTRISEEISHDEHSTGEYGGTEKNPENQEPPPTTRPDDARENEADASNHPALVKGFSNPGYHFMPGPAPNTAVAV